MKKLSGILLLAGILFACRNRDGKNTPKNLPQPRHNDSVTACVLSQLAYCSEAGKSIDTMLPGWKLLCDPASVNGNYAFVARNENTLAVAIRGSLLQFTEAALQNWLYQDLNSFAQEKWPYVLYGENAQVSAGAFAGWNNLLQLKDKTGGKTIWETLEPELRKGTPLLITGHSLGGNLATVLAGWLVWKMKQEKISAEVNVICFAAPAAGNRAFAENFNRCFPRAQCFANTNDMVVYFPGEKGIAALGDLFPGGPSAKEIQIGYKGFNTRLDKFFSLVADGVEMAALFGNSKGYVQPAEKRFAGKLSGSHNASELGNWFAEAAYQHGIKQYARSIGAPELACAPAVN